MKAAMEVTERISLKFHLGVCQFFKSFLCALVCAQLITHSECEKLDEYIHNFQPLSFNTGHLHKQHQRARRSATGHLRLNFRAYDRNFPLRLRRDTEIFSPDHGILEYKELKPVDTSFIYTGHVEGVPRSYVHLAIIGGTPRGHIHIPGNTTYHIEPAEQYFEKPEFHSIIYPESHMDKDPFRERRKNDDVGSCGMDRVKEWMDKVARSAIEEPPTQKKREKRSKPTDFHHFENEPAKSKYFAHPNTFWTQQERKKRAPLGENNTCFLYLRSDPMMWKFVKNEKFKQTLTDERAKEEILAFFASHVSALKNIFARTQFTTYNNELRYSGINFVVQRTSIMTPENQQCDTGNPSTYCNEHIDVSNFLNLNSMDQHNEFCLAYIFTHRDFTRGTLGLAWVGAREVASGGICERHKTYMEKSETIPKSLNTGIVTTVNYGKAVPARVSQLTFTHEVGHNFGSPHDQGDRCAPFGTGEENAQDGNYIMFASATMGDRPNNDDFSVCSLDNITLLLHAVINEQKGKRNCFKPSKTAFCGNGIKEEGEECDCGYATDCNDECCYGRDSVEGDQCTLRRDNSSSPQIRKVQCSPTAGPCCTASCQFITDDMRVQCLPQDDCKKATYCKYGSAECPAPKLEPNNTSCNDDAQLCYKGECVKSVCDRINWRKCFLTSVEGDQGPSMEALCYISCTNPETGQCVSSYNKEEVNRPENQAFRQLLLNVTRKRTGKMSVIEPEGIQLPAGSPCDNFRGYCDVFHKCRGVDADGPLARLKNLIFNRETLENIQQWIMRHWWAVLLMGIALIVVMGAFIKICAVHTPSSNPRKPKARQLTLPRTLQRRRHHQNQSQSQQQGYNNRGGNGGRGGGQSSGGGRERRPLARSVEERKPNRPVPVGGASQEPPPPYSSTAPLTSVEIVGAPSSSSSPAAPMIEPVGAPDLSAIPPGGPKRGRGGARALKDAAASGNKGKKGGKKDLELQRL